MMAGANLTSNIRVPDASQAGFNRPLNIVIDTNALLMKRLQCSALRETGQKSNKTSVDRARFAVFAILFRQYCITPGVAIRTIEAKTDGDSKTDSVPRVSKPCT